MREIEAREAKLAEASKRAEDFEKLGSLDELALLEEVARRTGKPLEQVLRRGIEKVSNGGQLTDEERAEQAQREQAARDARLEKLENELRERDAREQAAAQQRQMQEVVDNYKFATLDAFQPDVYPHLSAYTEEQIAMAAVKVADYIAGQTDEIPDPAYVLQQLEDNERQQWEARAAKIGYSRAPKAAPSELASNDDAENNESVHKRKIGGMTPLNPRKQPPPAEIELAPGVASRDANGKIRVGGATPTVLRPSLSNRDVSARGESPIDWRNMSERERIERAGQEVFNKGARR